MKIKIDSNAIGCLVRTGTDGGQNSYVTRVGVANRAILRAPEQLSAMRNAVVDAVVRMENGVLGTVPEHEVGKTFLVITVRRILPRLERADQTLSNLIANAPMRQR